MVPPTHSRYLFGFACAALILVGVGVGTLLAAARLRSDNGRVGHT